jgi:hypothetical protein
MSSDFRDMTVLRSLSAPVNWMERHMNNLIWLVGAVVIILAILGYLGLR